MPDAYTDPNIGGVDIEDDPYASPVAQPPHKSWGEWNSATGVPTDSPMGNLRNYGSHVKEWYIGSEEGLSPERSKAIDNALVTIANQGGFLGETEEERNTNAFELFTPPPPNKETNIGFVRKALGDDIARQFEYGSPDDPYYTNTLNEAKSILVSAGELPFATITSKDGSERQVIGRGNLPDGSSFSGAFKRAAMLGAVDYYTDAAQADAKQRTLDEDGNNVFILEQQNKYITALATKIGDTNSRAHYAWKQAQDEIVEIDQGKRKEFSDDLMSLVRAGVGESAESIGGRNFRSQHDAANITRAITILGAEAANRSGRFKYYGKEEEVAKNIRVFGGRGFAHPKLMTHKAQFDKALDGHDELRDSQKSKLSSDRNVFMERRFDHFNEIFSEGNATDDEWQNAYSKSLAGGGSKVDLLDEFLADPENYSHFVNSWAKFGASLEAGTLGFFASIGALFENEGAREYLLSEAREEARRDEVMRLFGEEWSWYTEASAVLAPMVADALIAIGATYVTGGVAAPFLVAAKATGSALTRKGVAKSLTLTLLRQKSKETVKETAERLWAKGIIKGSSEEVAVKGIMPAIEAYNKVLSNRILGGTYYRLTWANRSGGQMYTSVYSQLPEDMDHETKHSIALGAAAKAGLSTVLITSAFQKIGMGGFENALLKRGLTYRQMNGILTKLSGNVKALSKFDTGQILLGAMNARMKELGGRFTGILKRRGADALNEGLEEGLDELVQSFIEAASLNEDRPMMEHINQALMGAKLGAIIGAGATPAMRAARRLLQPDRRASLADRAKYEQEEIDNIIQTLRSPGVKSPLAAAELENWLRRQLAKDAREDVEEMPTPGKKTPIIPGAEPVIAPDAEPGKEVPLADKDVTTEEGQPSIKDPEFRGSIHRQLDTIIKTYRASSTTKLIDVLPRFKRDAEVGGEAVPNPQIAEAQADPNWNVTGDGIVYGVLHDGQWVGWPKPVKTDPALTTGEEMQLPEAPYPTALDATFGDYSDHTADAPTPAPLVMPDAVGVGEPGDRGPFYGQRETVAGAPGVRPPGSRPPTDYDMPPGTPITDSPWATPQAVRGGWEGQTPDYVAPTDSDEVQMELFPEQLELPFGGERRVAPPDPGEPSPEKLPVYGIDPKTGKPVKTGETLGYPRAELGDTGTVEFGQYGEEVIDQLTLLRTKWGLPIAFKDKSELFGTVTKQDIENAADLQEEQDSLQLEFDFEAPAKKKKAKKKRKPKYTETNPEGLPGTTNVELGEEWRDSHYGIANNKVIGDTVDDPDIRGDGTDVTYVKEIVKPFGYDRYGKRKKGSPAEIILGRRRASDDQLGGSKPPEDPSEDPPDEPPSIPVFGPQLPPGHPGGAALKPNGGRKPLPSRNEHSDEMHLDMGGTWNPLRHNPRDFKQKEEGKRTRSWASLSKNDKNKLLSDWNGLVDEPFIMAPYIVDDPDLWKNDSAYTLFNADPIINIIKEMGGIMTPQSAAKKFGKDAVTPKYPIGQPSRPSLGVEDPRELTKRPDLDTSEMGYDKHFNSRFWGNMPLLRHPSHSDIFTENGLTPYKAFERLKELNDSVENNKYGFIYGWDGKKKESYPVPSNEWNLTNFWDRINAASQDAYFLSKFQQFAIEQAKLDLSESVPQKNQEEAADAVGAVYGEQLTRINNLVNELHKNLRHANYQYVLFDLDNYMEGAFEVTKEARKKQVAALLGHIKYKNANRAYATPWNKEIVVEPSSAYTETARESLASQEAIDQWLPQLDLHTLVYGSMVAPFANNTEANNFVQERRFINDASMYKGADRRVPVSYLRVGDKISVTGSKLHSALPKKRGKKGEAPPFAKNFNELSTSIENLYAGRRGKTPSVKVSESRHTLEVIYIDPETNDVIFDGGDYYGIRTSKSLPDFHDAEHPAIQGKYIVGGLKLGNVPKAERMGYTGEAPSTGLGDYFTDTYADGGRRAKPLTRPDSREYWKGEGNVYDPALDTPVGKGNTFVGRKGASDVNDAIRNNKPLIVDVDAMFTTQTSESKRGVKVSPEYHGQIRTGDEGTNREGGPTFHDTGKTVYASVLKDSAYYNKVMRYVRSQQNEGHLPKNRKEGRGHIFVSPFVVKSSTTIGSVITDKSIDKRPSKKESGYTFLTRTPDELRNLFNKYDALLTHVGYIEDLGHGKRSKREFDLNKVHLVMPLGVRENLERQVFTFKSLWQKDKNYYKERQPSEENFEVMDKAREYADRGVNVILPVLSLTYPRGAQYTLSDFLVAQVNETVRELTDYQSMVAKRRGSYESNPYHGEVDPKTGEVKPGKEGLMRLNNANNISIGIYVSDTTQQKYGAYTVEAVKDYIEKVSTMGTEFSFVRRIHILNADKGTVDKILEGYDPAKAKFPVTVTSDATYDWQGELEENKESLKLKSVINNASTASRHANEEWNNNVIKRTRDANYLYSPTGGIPETPEQPPRHPDEVYLENLLGKRADDPLQPQLLGYVGGERVARDEEVGAIGTDWESRYRIVDAWMSNNKFQAAALNHEVTSMATANGFVPTFLVDKEVEGVQEFPEGFVSNYDQDALAAEAETLERDLGISSIEARILAETGSTNFDLRNKYYLRFNRNRILQIGGGTQLTIRPLPTYEEFSQSNPEFAALRKEAEDLAERDGNIDIEAFNQLPASSPARPRVEEYIRSLQEVVARGRGIATRKDNVIVTAVEEIAGELEVELTPEDIRNITDLIDHSASLPMLYDHLQNSTFVAVEDPKNAANKVISRLGIDAIVDYRSPADETQAHITVLERSVLKEGHPVTMDDAGVIIPPSQRFTRQPDERFLMAGAQVATEGGGDTTGMTQHALDNSNDSVMSDEEKVRRLHLMVRTMVDIAQSNGVPVHVVRSKDPRNIRKPAVYKVSGKRHKGLVYINPAGVLKASEDINSDAGLLDLARLLMTHESAHIASTRSIDGKLFNSVVEDTPDHVYEEMIDDYLVGFEGAEEARANMRTALDGDTIDFFGEQLDANEVKRMLVEERLRMHAERILTGYTSEEQVQFLRDNPGWLQLVLHYLKGIFKKYSAMYRAHGDSSRFGVATKRLVAEMRAMRNTYEPLVEVDPFDINDPSKDAVELAAIIGAEDRLFNPEAIKVNYIHDDENKKEVAEKIPYALLASPGITKFKGKAKDRTKPDYANLHYWVTGPQQELIDAAIDSGAVDGAASKLVDYITELREKHPHIDEALEWYPAVNRMLGERLGEKDAKFFPDLLAATSPNTGVEQNFQFAAEALTAYRQGKFDRHIQRYQEMYAYMEAGELLDVMIQRRVAPAAELRELTPKKLAAKWIEHYKILPLRPDAKGNMVQYGMNSNLLLRALSRRWASDQMDDYVSAKAPQFSKNIDGDFTQATIDVWAARTLRRLLYAGHKKRWRIQPASETGVADQDFLLGQLIFERAADQLGMAPANLQAIAWFAEKQVWSDNNWTKGAGEAQADFRESFEVFFPAGRKPRPFKHAKNIMTLIQKERLLEPEIYSQAEFDNAPEEVKKINEYKAEKRKRATHRREYKKSTELDGVPAFRKQRGYDPIRTANERVRKGFNTPGERDFPDTGGSLPVGGEEDVISTVYSTLGGEDYRGTHRAPLRADGGYSSLDAMDAETYPSDLYSTDGARLYGHGGTRDKEIHDLILKVRGKPKAKVTIYRGVPAEAGDELNRGDWVTPDRKYAEDHASRYGDDYKILTKEVQAGELITEGNSLYEYGYDPIPTTLYSLTGAYEDYLGGEEALKQTAPDLKVTAEDVVGFIESGTVAAGKLDDVTRGVSGKEMVDYLIEKTASPEHAALLKYIRPYVKHTVVKVPRVGNRVPSRFLRGNVGATHFHHWDEELGSNSLIYLRTGVGAYLDSETILHELLHAATQGRLVAGLKVANQGTKMAEAATGLNNLVRVVGDHFRAHGIPEGLRADVHYPSNFNADELIAWGLSNHSFQKMLQDVKIEGTQQSAFTKFIELIRELLGIPEDQTSAITEIIRLTEDLLKAPKSELPELRIDNPLAKSDLVYEPTEPTLFSPLGGAAPGVTSGTTYSGGGLVEWGLRGVTNSVFSIEHDAAIAKVHDKAHGGKTVVDDIRKATEQLGKLAGLHHHHSSPPCVASSKQQAHPSEVSKAAETEYGQIVADAIRKYRNPVFTLENVTAYKDTDAYRMIAEALDDVGYTHDAWDKNIYNAADYGAPTTRLRLMVRATLTGTLPEVKKQPRGNWFDPIEDLIDGLPDSDISRTKNPAIFRGLDAKGVDPKKINAPILISGTTQGWKGESRASVVGVTEPAFPFPASPKQAHRVVMPDGRIKRLDARAMARITGLSDDYPLPEDNKLGHQIIGNGVPPPMALAIFGPLLAPPTTTTTFSPLGGDITEGEVHIISSEPLPTGARPLEFEGGLLKLDGKTVSKEVTEFARGLGKYADLTVSKSKDRKGDGWSDKLIIDGLIELDISATLVAPKERAPTEEGAIRLARGTYVPDGGITVESVKAIKKGSGVRALQLLTKVADDLEVELTGKASAFGTVEGSKGLPTDKLIRFYKHFGFTFDEFGNGSRKPPSNAIKLKGFRTVYSPLGGDTDFEGPSVYPYPAYVPGSFSTDKLIYMLAHNGRLLNYDAARDLVHALRIRPGMSPKELLEHDHPYLASEEVDELLKPTKPEDYSPEQWHNILEGERWSSGESPLIGATPGEISSVNATIDEEGNLYVASYIDEDTGETSEDGTVGLMTQDRLDKVFDTFRSGSAQNPHHYKKAVMGAMSIGAVAQTINLGNVDKQPKTNPSRPYPEGEFRAHHARLMQYWFRGGRVFLDSGAFPAFSAKRKILEAYEDTDSNKSTNERGAEVLTKLKPKSKSAANLIKDVIDDPNKALLNYEAIMDFYEEWADNAKNPYDTLNLTVVAPDIIGDPEGSKALQDHYKGRILALLDKGVNVVVPAQRPNVAPGQASFAEAVEEIAKIFGADTIKRSNFIIGAPSTAKAWTEPEVTEYVSNIQPHDRQAFRVHMLGANDNRVRNMGAKTDHVLVTGDRQADFILFDKSPEGAPTRGARKELTEKQWDAFLKRAWEYAHFGRQVEAGVTTTWLFSPLGGGSKQAGFKTTGEKYFSDFMQELNKEIGVRIHPEKPNMLLLGGEDEEGAGFLKTGSEVHLSIVDVNKPNAIRIEYISSFTPKKGYAGKALKAITNAADKAGIDLELMAQKVDKRFFGGIAEPGMSTEQLAEWYERNDFVFDPKMRPFGFDGYRAFKPQPPEGESLNYNYSTLGVESESDEEILNATKFKNVLRLFELPVLHAGDYQAGHIKVPFWRRFFGRPFTFFTGVLDKRVQRLDDQRKFMLNASLSTIKEFHRVLTKQATDTYGALDQLDAEVIDTISKAIGSTKGATLSSAQVEAIEKDGQIKLEESKRQLELIVKEAKKKKLSKKKFIKGEPEGDYKKYSSEFNKKMRQMAKDQADAYIAIQEAVRQAIVNEKRQLREAEAARLKTERAHAIDKIRQKSPELADTIDELRRYIDALSVKVKQIYGANPELQARIDNQLGIYLTRSYKIFTEHDWADKVLSEDSFRQIRQDAAEFFTGEAVKNRATTIFKVTNRRAKKDNFDKISMEEAEVMAKQEIDAMGEGNESFGERQVRAFIDSYRHNGYMSAQSGKGEGYHPLVDSLRAKKELDPELAELLGEYKEDTVFDNMYRTFVNLHTMAANQNFMLQTVQLGRRDGWLLTEDELAQKIAEDPEVYGQGNFITVRKSAMGKKIKPNTLHDPFLNHAEINAMGEKVELGALYAPKAFVEGLANTFEPSLMKGAQDEASHIAQRLHGIASKATGISMGVKTLGSIGFYIRNIVSNMCFFGPSQGFIRWGKMGGELMMESKRWLGKGKDLDAEIAELTALGIVGDELRPSMLKELYMGGETPASLMQELDDHLNKAQELSKKGKTFVDGAKDTSTFLLGKAQELSRRVDAFYKIAYFKHELEYLKKAQADAQQRGDTNDKHHHMTEEELMREAARKVLMTAQSYSQAPPFVKGAIKSWYGLVFAPFLRFRLEVPRILINSVKLGLEEVSSSNPVMKKRGRIRLTWLFTTVGGLGAALPYLIAKAYGGLTDEEDEANRASMPSYLRSHTFITFKGSKAWDRIAEDSEGKIISFDMTYLNPYSSMADPFLRAFSALARGKGTGDAASAWVSAMFTNQFLDDQIVAGTVFAMKKNKHPDTDTPIYEETDDFSMVMKKLFQFGLSEAYVPPTLERVGKGTEIAKIITGEAGIGKFDPIVNLFHEFMPTRPHVIEPKKQLERYLRVRGDEMRRARLIKRRMKADDISDEDIRDFARNDVETRMRINKDLLEKFKGFEGMGLSRGEVYHTAKDKNYGKRRLILLSRGYMERPVLSPTFQREMAALGGEYVRRMRIFQEEVNKMPRYIPLD